VWRQLGITITIGTVDPFEILADQLKIVFSDHRVLVSAISNHNIVTVVSQHLKKLGLTGTNTMCRGRIRVRGGSWGSRNFLNQGLDIRHGSVLKTPQTVSIISGDSGGQFGRETKVCGEGNSAKTGICGCHRCDVAKKRAKIRMIRHKTSGKTTINRKNRSLSTDEHNVVGERARSAISR